MDQQEENSKVVEPLTQANEDVDRLGKQKESHDRIMSELAKTQKEIADFDERTRDIEWQYDVRLQ